LNTIVTETTEQGEIPMDVYQKLASSRILFLNSDIDDKLATDIVATLLVLDAENCDDKISLFINSHGGDIRNILMIYDTMKMLQSPIETICVGAAVDESAILLSSGTKGMRFATKNSVISMGPLENQIFSVGNLTDAKKLLELHTRDNRSMMEIIAKNTQKSVKQVMADFDRKTFFSPQQAAQYGLIDQVITSAK
jgi:ATP-dependent Clp protease, protease subunit